ncbi:Hypothetical protein Minf_1446 [Methylacidiphilum infernorum V4]|uniref:Uncharacterized protein n=1 Tax=Methylacidiphilum infernorum (isolate V4) TaxID=481448 RepID=B3DVZ7_METI4|nr:Hypothetical protein Minf_1446 [Methylacidiphilum infernorum V4]
MGIGKINFRIFYLLSSKIEVVLKFLYGCYFLSGLID